MVAHISTELRESLVWALILAVPMTLFALSGGIWFAGWFAYFLFAPIVAMVALAEHGGLLAGMPQLLLFALGGLLQFLWCWLGVLLLRFFFRTDPSP